MLRNNPARPGVQQQWADVGVQMARVQGDIATTQARIALKQGLPGGLPGVVVARPPWSNPALVIPTVSIVSLTLLLPLAIGWARRISRRAPPPPAISSDVMTRLERIEQAVDSIAIEVERVSEGQRFVTKIMTQKPAPAASNAGSPADQASSQSKQPLALGAGEAPAQTDRRARARAHTQLSSARSVTARDLCVSTLELLANFLYPIHDHADLRHVHRNDDGQVLAIRHRIVG
jgi:hypothetical protein